MHGFGDSSAEPPVVQPRQGRKSPASSYIPCCRREVDAVAKATEFANHLRSSTVGARFNDRRAALLIGDAIVQDLPHKPTEAMCDRSDRLGMASKRTTSRRYSSSKILPF